MKAIGIPVFLALCLLNTAVYAQANQGPAGCGRGFCAKEEVDAPIGCGAGACAHSNHVAIHGVRHGGNDPRESLSDRQDRPELNSTLVVATSRTVLPAFSAARGVLDLMIEGIDKSAKICTPSPDRLSDIPAPFWREALLQRRQLLKCDGIVRAISEHRIGRHSADYFSFLAGLPGSSRETLARLFTEYKDNCVQQVKEYAGSRPFKALFGVEFAQMIQDNFGLLQVRNSEGTHTCSAAILRFGTGDKNLMLATAAHCIGLESNLGISRVQIVEANKDIEFRVLNGSTFKVAVDQDIIGWSRPTGSDLALLPVTNAAVPSTVKGFAVGDVSQIRSMDPLYLVGVNPIALTAMKASGARDQEALEAATTIAMSTPCRVIGVADGKIAHDCETEKQMSGSPIFAVTSAGPVVVAIHNEGQDESLPLSKCKEDSWTSRNYGSILPRPNWLGPPSTETR